MTLERIGALVIDVQPQPAWRVWLWGDDPPRYATFISLCGSRITDTELALVSQLTQLQHLVLINTRVTDAGLVNLQGLTELQGLTLESNRVTDAGLKHLAGLLQL